MYLDIHTYIYRVYTKRMVRFQKLTRNLYLTLHGQNLHRQQRQLSKFLMRYQQFAFHAYCGAAGSVSKMASQQEKAFCVLRFEVSISVIAVQREFRAARFRKDASCMVQTDKLINIRYFRHIPEAWGSSKKQFSQHWRVRCHTEYILISGAAWIYEVLVRFNSLAMKVFITQNRHIMIYIFI